MVYEKIKTNREKRNKSKEKRPSTIAITLIHEEHKEIIQGENRISLIYFILIIFGWVFEEQAIDKYNSTLCHLDFWMFELIIIAYLNSKMLHIEIYKHQKFVLIFSLIPIFFKIITITSFSIPKFNLFKIFGQPYNINGTALWMSITKT